MDVNFAPVIGVLLPLALSAATAAIGVGVPWALRLAHKRLGVALTAHQVAVLTQAADKGAELAYGFLVGNTAHYADVPMRNAAIATGVNHVLASVPAAMKALGLTPDHVHAMVDARLGGLLAKDPTVSIAPPAAPKSPPVAAPQAADKPAS